MIIHVTSDYGQIGPFKWINSNQIPHGFDEGWFIVWGATFGLNGGTFELEEVKQ